MDRAFARKKQAADEEAARQLAELKRRERDSAALQIQEVQVVMLARFKRYACHLLCLSVIGISDKLFMFFVPLLGSIWEVCESSFEEKMAWLDKYAQLQVSAALPHALALAEEVCLFLSHCNNH